MSEKPSEYSFDEIEIGMQKNFKIFIAYYLNDIRLIDNF